MGLIQWMGHCLGSCRAGLDTHGCCGLATCVAAGCVLASSVGKFTHTLGAGMYVGLESGIYLLVMLRC
jgi:hypothetical protein